MAGVTVENRRLVDLDTGEIIETPAIKSYEPDYNFHKVWMRSFLSALGEIGNKKMKVCNFLLERMNVKNNKVSIKQEEIAFKCSVSIVTVNQTFKILQRAGFLKKEEYGQYMINPDIVFKGLKDRRNVVMHIYNDMEQEKPNIYQKYNQLKRTEKQIKNELKKLENKINEKEQAEAELKVGA